ncbi:MAG: Uma2 family endonuclease [Roseiflexaceae bacterium]|nr:Uma2 family endonuclease [Roseiflexaceae bacterium]
MTTLDIIPAATIEYPESDGQPMGETDLHRILMNELIFALRWFLNDVKAYVAGNLFVYYEEGNPKAVVAPDVFVVFGAELHMRRTYKAWEEDQKLPDVVIELTSRSTRQADQKDKPALYERLGVREYFVFDPYAEYLRPQLQGYRLVGSSYKRIEAFPMYSEVLNLELRVEDQTLRLYNPETGERLPTADEVVLARREAEWQLRKELVARLNAEVRAAEQSARADAAEAELARLRAERATQ